MAEKRTSIVIEEDELFNARQTALSLSQETPNIQDLLYSQNLDDVESGIRKLNEMADKCWLLSSITLYALIYNQNMYTQSGLDWSAYLADSKKRLGLDKREISAQLSSARFFIKYHEKLVQKGWTPSGSARKLEKAELALELSGSLSKTITHLAQDSWRDFQSWYTSFKVQPALPATQSKNIVFKANKVFVDNIEAVIISEKISKEDRELYSTYIRQLFEILKNGDEPAIISVYDKNEAVRLEHLRDKARSER